jgi:hypothetical protein
VREGLIDLRGGRAISARLVSTAARASARFLSSAASRFSSRMGSEVGCDSRSPLRDPPTGRGSNVPARSRGTSKATSPTSVASVFGVVPLREFPERRPAGSPFA